MQVLKLKSIKEDFILTKLNTVYENINKNTYRTNNYRCSVNSHHITYNGNIGLFQDLVAKGVSQSSDRE